MPEAFSVLSKSLYIVWLPTSKILHAIAAIIAPFWSLALFILLPLTYLTKAILYILLLPFNLHFLERVETLYIYLGMATLVGMAAGTTLFLICKFLTSAFHIDDAFQPPPPLPRRQKKARKGRTMQEFRSARQDKSGSESLSASSGMMRIPAPARRRGLISQAIMEEESEF